MVYFGKKQTGNLTNYYTKTEADNRYARLASPNTFTATNTFNTRINSNKGFETNTNNADIMKLDYQQEKSANVVYKQSSGGYKNYCNMKYLWTNNDTAYTNLLTFIFKPDTSVNEVEFNSGLGSFSFNKKVNFKSDIELKSPTSNNGAFLTNFQYQNQNLTSLKFVKNPSKAMLILEVNNDNETANISTPNKVDGLTIKNLANPTQNNDATNKQYVDGIVKYIEKAGGLSFTKQEISTVAGARVNKYYANINYSTINIPNGKHIISCYCKTIPSSGQHLVITFFPQYATNQCLIEIYQYNNTTDITTQLNGATYCFTYLNV